jgi:uncharacterized surface protein with fasciclin (FAS1) repeats
LLAIIALSAGANFALAAPRQQAGDIVDIAVADGRFTTLVAALEAADLVDTLKSPGPFTVFAPTDDAFAKLPDSTLDALLNDIPTLTQILLYHVVPGNLLAADVVQVTELTTVQGENVEVRVENNTVFINDAQIIITDIQASNGVIHVIDTVLTPPSLLPPATVYVVHGIPGQDLGADPALPVDVSVNGDCALPGFSFGQIAGPLSLPAGDYEIAISVANSGAPCSNTPVIGPVTVPFADGENISIVAHLTEQGAPTASKFANDVSAIRNRARLVARHVAAAPAVDIRLFRLSDQKESQLRVFKNVTNGQEAQTELNAGRLKIGIFVAGTRDEVLEVRQRLEKRKLYLEYVVGSPANGTLQLLEQVIDLPSP